MEISFLLLLIHNAGFLKEIIVNMSTNRGALCQGEGGAGGGARGRERRENINGRKIIEPINGLAQEFLLNFLINYTLKSLKTFFKENLQQHSITAIKSAFV